MAKHSLYDQKTTITNLSVQIDGSAINAKVTVAGLTVYKSLNKISTARIELFDGNISDAEFETIENDKYEPGAEIKIGMGYENQDDIIFEGILVKHSVKISERKAAKIYLECADKAIELTGQRKFEYFTDKKDSDIITTLCRSIEKEVEATDKTHERVIQHNTSDWDFIVTRAQANGMLVSNDKGKITVKKPKTGSAKIDLIYGENIIETDLTVDARTQIKEIKAFGWDPKVQDIAEGSGEEPTELEKVGSLQGKSIAGKLKYKETKIKSSGTLDSEELKAWASGTLLMSRLSRIRGTIKTQGIVVDPTDTVEIQSIGKYYDGEAFVTGVYHELKEGNWVTDVEVGLKPEFFVHQKEDVTLPVADGLFPGVHGLFIGVVKQIDSDPEGHFRVRVVFPMVDGKEGEGVWARVTNIMASDKFGSWFMPEVDDEVICGAIGGDLRFPVILGHLYSSKRPYYDKEFSYDSNNDKKGWFTRGELLFHFDDKDKIIRVETPGGQKFKLDDKEKSITLEDQHKNKMVMDSSGFKFSGMKDFVVDVKGKVDGKAMGNIAWKTMSGNFDAQGMNSTLKGTMGANVEAGPSSLKASMMSASLKGPMVMIN